MKPIIFVAVTTFNREESCKKLIDQIIKYSLGKYRLVIKVYDDCSNNAYNLNNRPVQYFRFKENNGKRGYWKIINQIFHDAQCINFDYFFLLQDDCSLINNFFEESIRQYEKIPKEDRSTLCTFTPDNVYDRIMWGGKAKDVFLNKEKYIEGDYVDCIFMCDQNTLNILNYEVYPISNQFWRNDPNRSSGVGFQLTRRLRAMGKKMYTVYSSLVDTGNLPSIMNPEERVKNPLYPLKRSSEKEGVYVGIASIPEREEELRICLQSICYQATRVFVALNGYKKLPSYANEFDNVEFILTDNSRGDANKFLKYDQVSGYFFTCDDDILYPFDYVKKMISKLNKYGGIVTLHGRTIYKQPIKNFFTSTKRYAFYNELPVDVRIHIPGTGVSAYKTSEVFINMDHFPIKNMADIWVGIYANNKNIPVTCIERQEGWCKQIPTKSNSIYSETRNNGGNQTRIINNNIWRKL